MVKNGTIFFKNGKEWNVPNGNNAVPNPAFSSPFFSIIFFPFSYFCLFLLALYVYTFPKIYRFDFFSSSLYLYLFNPIISLFFLFLSIFLSFLPYHLPLFSLPLYLFIFSTLSSPSFFRVGHRVLLRSERSDLSRSKKRTLRSFTFFSRVFGDL